MLKKIIATTALMIVMLSSASLYSACKDISGTWFLYIYDIYDDTCGTSLFGFEKFLNGTGALITVEQNQCNADLNMYFASNLPSQSGELTGDNLTTEFSINLADVGLKYDVKTEVAFEDYLGEGIAYYTATAYNIKCTFKSHLKFVKVALLSSDSSCSGTAVEQTFTKSFVDSLGTGWSLSGTCENITDLSIFADVKTVWSWNGSSWSIYSPIDTVKELIKKYSISQLTGISAKSGFWINK
jgi:hypothetical protein